MNLPHVLCYNIGNELLAGTYVFFSGGTLRAVIATTGLVCVHEKNADVVVPPCFAHFFEAGPPVHTSSICWVNMVVAINVTSLFLTHIMACLMRSRVTELLIHDCVW